MNRPTGVSNFKSTMIDIVKEYGDEVVNVFEKVMDDVAKEGAQELKNSNGSPAFQDQTGKYRRGWKTTKRNVRGVQLGKLAQDVIIHNATEYRKTHLLEFGHAKKGGGRTRAFVHIEPVNERVQEKFFNEFIREVKNL